MRAGVRPLRVAVVLGNMGLSVHGTIDVEKFLDEGFATGTMMGFFGIAWGLAERGHTVDAFCQCVRDVPNSKYGHANFYEWPKNKPDGTYDAYISISEPDLLRPESTSAWGLRVCVVWLNDFTYCQPGFDHYVDLYVSPSHAHREFMTKIIGMSADRSCVVPINTNIELFDNLPRRPGSLAYCSSPDRGLHHLAKILPLVRKQVPEAHLSVYYRYWPWLEEMQARKQGDGLRKFAEDMHSELTSTAGIEIVGAVSPSKLARSLSSTMVLPYPCDPRRFTEGYSVAVLDACAAGCVPVLSGADVLPSVYGGAAEVIEGPVEHAYQEWADNLVLYLTDPEIRQQARQRAFAHAYAHSRQRVAEMWEQVLYRRIG